MPAASRIAATVAELGMRTWPENYRAPHYLCVRSPVALSTLVEALAAERIFVSVRGESVRVTPHVYNSAEDVERFLSVFARHDFTT